MRNSMLLWHTMLNVPECQWGKRQLHLGKAHVSDCQPAQVRHISSWWSVHNGVTFLTLNSDLEAIHALVRTTQPHTCLNTADMASKAVTKAAGAAVSLSKVIGPRNML